VKASKVTDVTRLRLFQRADGAVVIVVGASDIVALHADDLSSAKVQSERLALAIAIDHARRRRLDTTRAAFAALAAYDQWTVSNGLDRHRPLYRIALHDQPGTELYVSSATGEVVRDTTRSERWWNYAGSVPHWIYPTILRRNARVWETIVWTVSLVALIAALSGSVLGILRIGVKRGRLVSPLRGWHAWHHALGLGCMTFVLTWIFSGWLSLDNGRLFSTGKVAEGEATIAAGPPDWDSPSAARLPWNSAEAVEIEWFSFGGKFYQRERFGLQSQRLFSDDLDVDQPLQEFLRADEIGAAASRIATDCNTAFVIPSQNNYAVASAMPNAPVYRALCGNFWFHIDGASGAILEKLDRSRRTYRWLYTALHTLDIPALEVRPALQTTLVLLLCTCGLTFSFTAVVIAWRRMRYIGLRLGGAVERDNK
jgi:hypothetical protein